LQLVLLVLCLWPCDLDFLKLKLFRYFALEQTFAVADFCFCLWQTWTDIDWDVMRGLDLHKGGKNKGKPLVKPDGELLDPVGEPPRLSRAEKDRKDSDILRLAEVCECV
jgi:hypothetical protein